MIAAFISILSGEINIVNRWISKNVKVISIQYWVKKKYNCHFFYLVALHGQAVPVSFNKPLHPLRKETFLLLT